MRYFVFVLIKGHTDWSQIQVDSLDSANALMHSLDKAINIEAARIVTKLPLNSSND